MAHSKKQGKERRASRKSTAREDCQRLQHALRQSRRISAPNTASVQDVNQSTVSISNPEQNAPTTTLASQFVAPQYQARRHVTRKLQGTDLNAPDHAGGPSHDSCEPDSRIVSSGIRSQYDEQRHATQKMRTMAIDPPDDNEAEVMAEPINPISSQRRVASAATIVVVTAPTTTGISDSIASSISLKDIPVSIVLCIFSSDGKPAPLPGGPLLCTTLARTSFLTNIFNLVKSYPELTNPFSSIYNLDVSAHAAAFICWSDEHGARHTAPFTKYLYGDILGSGHDDAVGQQVTEWKQKVLGGKLEHTPWCLCEKHTEGRRRHGVEIPMVLKHDAVMGRCRDLHDSLELEREDLRGRLREKEQENERLRKLLQELQEDEDESEFQSGSEDEDEEDGDDTSEYEDRRPDHQAPRRTKRQRRRQKKTE